MRNAALLAVIVAVVAGAVTFAFDLERAGQPSFWLGLALPYVALGAFAVLRAARDGVASEALRPRWGDFTRGFFVTLVLFAGAYAVTKLLVPAGSPREGWLARIYLQIGSPDALRTHAIFVGIGLFVMAFLEEVVWRGLVTDLVAEIAGSRAAWIIAAVLYAVAHLPAIWVLRDPEAGLNPLLPFAALGCGLVWGAAARQVRRLPPVIIAHALFDWCLVMMFRLWGPSV